MFTVSTLVKLAPLFAAFVAGYAADKYAGVVLGTVWQRAKDLVNVVKGDLKSAPAPVATPVQSQPPAGV